MNRLHDFMWANSHPYSFRCPLDMNYCSGSKCPAYVRDTGGCYVDGLMNAVSDLSAEIEDLRADLKNIKHRTMRGGW
mgnify:CR=1 FL=1